MVVDVVAVVIVAGRRVATGWLAQEHVGHFGDRLFADKVGKSEIVGLVPESKKVKLVRKNVTQNVPTYFCPIVLQLLLFSDPEI